jgi:hypothetical protein
MSLTSSSNWSTSFCWCSPVFCASFKSLREDIGLSSCKQFVDSAPLAGMELPHSNLVGTFRKGTTGSFNDRIDVTSGTLTSSLELPKAL